MQLKFEKWFSTDPLPPVWRGRRRRTFSLLLTSGFAQGLLAVIAGSAMSRLTSTDVPALRIVIFLVLSALAMGALRIFETTFAERLGQQYVAETRHIIIEDALGPSRSPNIGITVARATNDLSAVRSWVVSGVSRIAAGIPLLVGVLISLFILSPAVAAVLLLCLIGFGLYLYQLAPRAYSSFREMRRRRGRMASFVADAVRAAPSIHAAGGMERELNNVDKLSEQVEETAVSAAKASGAMAGGASAITMLMMVLTTVAATLSGLKGGELTTVMLLASVLTDPVADLGRITELRQGFNAANYALAGVVERTQTRSEFTSGATGSKVSTRPSEIHIGSGSKAPFLVAKPGSRVLLRSKDRETLEPILSTLLGASATSYISFGDAHVDLTDDETRRKLIGYASSEHELEQGTLARAVRYRRPNSKQSIKPLLKKLGLSETVAALPKQHRTKLRRGGEPLSASERMRVLLARALYDTPPVLLLEDISMRSTQQDIEVFRAVLADYPGVVIVVDQDDEVLFSQGTIWDIDSDEQMVIAKSAVETVKKTGDETKPKPAAKPVAPVAPAPAPKPAAKPVAPAPKPVGTFVAHCADETPQSALPARPLKEPTTEYVAQVIRDDQRQPAAKPPAPAPAAAPVAAPAPVPPAAVDAEALEVARRAGIKVVAETKPLSSFGNAVKYSTQK